MPNNSFVDDQVLLLLVDDDDIDYKRKVATIRVGVVQSGFHGFSVKTSCYDTMDSLGLDPEELNLVMYNRKKGTVTSLEVEDFSTASIKKQVEKLRTGLGKKLKLSLFESYIASKDCSYGNEDSVSSKKATSDAEQDL